MESNIKLLEQILSALKEKHKQTDNLMTLTKELERVMETNDPESFGAVLSMRHTSMAEIDRLNDEVRIILEGMEQASREKIIMILSPELPEGILTRECQVESEIFETNRMTMSILRRMVELDEKINKRIKGG